MIEVGRVCPWAVGELSEHAHSGDMPSDWPCRGEGITVSEALSWVLKSAPLDQSGWDIPERWEGTE